MKTFLNSPAKETEEEMKNLKGEGKYQHLKKQGVWLLPQYRLLQMLVGSEAGFIKLFSSGAYSSFA